MVAADKMKKENLNSSLNSLFYLSKVLGIITYSSRDYYSTKIFKISIIGIIYSIITVVHNCVQYHIATVRFSLGNEREAGTLTVIIGIFIIYMEPLMMTVDIIAAIINQRHLIVCLDRMQKVDDKLEKENIQIDYVHLKQFIIRLILIITIGELSLVLCNFFQYQNVRVIESIWWFVTFVPLYMSSLSKIWYALLVYNVRQKFNAINDYFETTQKLFYETKLRKRRAAAAQMQQGNNTPAGNNEGTKSSNSSTNDWKSDKNPEFVEHTGYLHREIHSKHLTKRNRVSNRAFEMSPNIKSGKIIQVRPVDTGDSTDRDHLPPYTIGSPPNPFGIKQDHQQQQQQESQEPPIQYFNDYVPFSEKLVIDDKLDKKLTLLCHLHDEICEVGKIVNQMFSFQMLLLMAYGFMSITAQCYFVYCGLVGQVIPELFRSAESLIISTFMITFTSVKCVYVIYISWQTKVDGQKTGVKIHKVANVIDEDHFYQTVNHLSLKLLNHQINFTACGFFDLDMTTLYAITGAITSYLIILIQFNLAAQRNRKSNTNSTMINSTMINSTAIQ